MRQSYNNKQNGEIVVIIAVTLGTLFCIGFAFWFFPTYSVWSQAKYGEAELRKSEWNKQVLVEEARANFESAKMLSQAEIERAKGVAEANKIIGESLSGNEAYLRYLWINQLGKETNNVIYVPTEANLPILEATRHTK